jgi:glutamate synthase (NADPH/NADH) large chain
MTNGTVVILGRTGRNFGAGMSGGIAYVFDEDGDFARVRCNLAGVDLDPIFEGEDVLLLQKLIHKHVEYTGSAHARRILENWHEAVRRFVKVFPHEYKRVLGVPRTPELRDVPRPLPIPSPLIAVHEGAR